MRIYDVKVSSFVLKESRENSPALFSQDSFISKHFSGVKYLTQFTISSILQSASIKIHVSLWIIVSFNHHSFTHNTGFHAAILSTGLIQKSSSIGI
jgi:hypothetical protein